MTLPQLLFLDPTYYRTAKAWREAYCVQNYFMGWDFVPARRPKLATEIDARSFRVTKAECLDLPETVDLYQYITLPKDVMRALRELRDGLVTLLDGRPIITTNVLTSILRQLQICAEHKADAVAEVFDAQPTIMQKADFHALVERVARVEESAKSLHKRIDRLEGKGP